MDQVFVQIRTDLASNDGMRQAQALLIALQHAAAGRDVSSISKSACEEIIASPASAVCKKLAFDLIRSTRLSVEQWESVCRGIRNDFDFPDSDVTAAAVSFLAAIPSWRLGKLITDCSKEISNCIVSENANLRYAIVDTLGCILARDDMVTLCASSATLLDRVNVWWTQIGQSMLDHSDAVSWIAFEGVGRLFQEYSSKKLSRLAGDKLAPSEAGLAIRSHWVASMCRFVWEKRSTLIARSLILPMESLRDTVFPLVFAVKAVATRMVDKMQVLSGVVGTPRDPAQERAFENAERILAVSDIVSHFSPFLSSLEPALVYEIGINLLSLADVPGGKPEWAAAPVIALLTLWDRQEFAAGRETIVRAVVTNLHLLDFHLQVSLFKRLLLIVRNLRVEADRMDALASICQTALSVDLFAKESVRRGQKPLPGTDIVSLFEESKVKEDMLGISSSSLFREELVACLVESCFQLSLPLPRLKASGPESRAVGALLYGTGHESMSWTKTALEVVEVCRPCVRWDCQGRTYAMDCYLKLLVRLCCLYDTKGGVKQAKDGASPEQILADTRLATLQRQLVKDLADVATPRLRSRVIWALAEHFDLEGLDPLLADDPEDPLNILIDNIHKVLFNADSAVTAVTNRLQDVQAALLCARHLGSRNLRALQLLTKEIEEFRNSSLADSVNKHQCRLVLQVFCHISKHPESRWVGMAPASGDYPFSHHKLSVQYFDSSAAQDRKLEDLVHTAVEELWRPQPTELELVTSKDPALMQFKTQPRAKTVSGSSDPCYVEIYHLMDASDRRLTVHLKVINMTELELSRVDVRVGLGGPLRFMDSGVQAGRVLQKLASQDPVLCSVTVGVTKFERCAIHVQMLYYPSYGANATAGEDEAIGADDEGWQKARLLRVIRPELGKPVVLRCQPYRIPLIELLLPRKCSPVEFFRIWPSLPGIVEFTAAYTYKNSGFKPHATDSDSPHFLVGLKAIGQKPFHRVCSHVLRSVGGFQICYAAKTWYGDFLGMLVFGASEVNGDIDLRNESNSMMCKFVLGASSPGILDEISADLQYWLDDLTDGELRVVSDEEAQAAAELKLQKSKEQQAAPRFTVSVPPAKEEEESLVPGMEQEPPEPSTLTSFKAEEMEHRALQAAVLEQWEAFRLLQVVH